MTRRDGETTISDILKVLVRHWRLFLVGASLFALAVLLLSHWIPLSFTGAAMFERRLDAAIEKTARTRSESFEDTKVMLQHELAGETAVLKAMEDLGLDRNLPRTPDGALTEVGQVLKERRAQELMKTLRVTWEVRSDHVDVVKITFTHHDPRLAKQFPNTLVENYINGVSEQVIHRLEQSRDFLLAQVKECDGRMEELTKKKLDFVAKYGGALVDDPHGLQQRMEDVTADIETLRQRQALARQKLVQLKALTQSVQSGKLGKQLEQWQAKLDEALAQRHMTESHPQVQALRQSIADLERRMEEVKSAPPADLADEDEPALNNVTIQMVAVTSELQAIDNEIIRLENRRKGYEMMQGNSAHLLFEYSQITKPLDALEQESERWSQQLTNVQVALTAEQAKQRTQLSTIKLARKPPRPAFPRLWVIVSFAVCGGLAFGYVLAFCANAADHSIASAEDAAGSFGVPVCGVIDEIVTARDKILRRAKQQALTLVVSLVLIASLALVSFSVLLRLKYPEKLENMKPAFLNKPAATWVPTHRAGEAGEIQTPANPTGT